MSDADARPTRRWLLVAGLSAATAACSQGTPPSGAAVMSSGKTSSTPGSASAARPVNPSGAEPTNSPQRAAAVLREAPEVRHGPRRGSSVALTFHGAGERSIAREVLAELRRAAAPGTVLAVGTWLDADPAIARLVLDQGHELGNHTQHHLPMRTLSEAAARREIADCAARLRRLTGSAGRWFRPSGTRATNAVIRRAAAAAGYRRCLSYDVDSTDWQDPGADAVVAAVAAAVRPGSVISLHLGHRGTVAALPPLLDLLARRGLHPVTVSKLLG